MYCDIFFYKVYWFEFEIIFEPLLEDCIVTTLLLSNIGSFKLELFFYKIFFVAIIQHFLLFSTLAYLNLRFNYY